MRKPFLPQIKIARIVYHFHSLLLPPFFDICFTELFVVARNSKDFFRDTSSKKKERDTFGNSIVFAKTNRTLHLFLKTQNTNNQTNNNALDKGHINTTDV